MGNFIVYKHTSPSGKCYVGITSQAPECRWGNDGCKYLEIHKNGKLKHPYFAQAILKYGWDIVVTINPIEKLLEGSNGSGIFGR